MHQNIQSDEVVHPAAAAEDLGGGDGLFKVTDQFNQDNPSYNRLSLSFEPQASRLKLVVALEPLQQLAKAGQLMMERMGSVPDDGGME